MLDTFSEDVSYATGNSHFFDYHTHVEGMGMVRDSYERYQRISFSVDVGPNV